MTIQTSIIEALKASHAAHQAGLAEVKTLRAEKSSLLEKVATLESRVATLQAESVKIVEPATVQPLLDELARAVAATHAAISPQGPQLVQTPNPQASKQGPGSDAVSAAPAGNQAAAAE